MSTANARPDILLGRPVSFPAHFAPSVSWTSQGYIYKYDPVCRIVKRTPVRPDDSDGSSYFAVTNRLMTSKAEVAPSNAAKHRTKTNSLVAKLSGPVLSIAVIAAIALLAYPWMPEVSYRVRQITPHQTESLTAPTGTTSVTDNRVIIPKIGVSTPILEGPNLKILDKREGVWHQTGAQGNGNLVLAGHRFKYLPPNTSTLYNLGKLAAGDILAVDWEGKRTVYRVTQLKTVGAKDVSILNPTGQAQITIYTCSDVRMSKRVVVVAVPLPKA